jgi:CheY-like chemotaxis protein
VGRVVDVSAIGPVNRRTETVLVVEDSQVIRRVLTLLLEGEGYRVVATDRGREAVTLAREQRPDVVTLDLALADADGRETLRQLKQDPVTQHIPIVVLSAFVQALSPAERWYAADIILKPFDVDDLLRRLSRVVRPDLTDARDRRRGPRLA